ncbi:MAG: NAD(P)-dependent oxidoreductase [Halobacteria archaeon]
MDPHPLPLHLLVEGRRCVVVGGGREALHKTRLLLGSGATVAIYNPGALDPALRRLARQNRIPHIRRWAAPADLRDSWMTFHTEPGLDPRITALSNAALRNRWLFSATDAPALSTIVMPAIARKGLLQVAVGTGNASPATAVRIRDAIADAAGPEFTAHLRRLARLRRRVRRGIPDAEERKEAMRRASRGLRVSVRLRAPPRRRRPG